jgi:hypothetical protein
MGAWVSGFAARSQAPFFETAPGMAMIRKTNPALARQQYISREFLQDPFLSAPLSI